MAEYQLVLQARSGDILCFDIPVGASILGRGNTADIRIQDGSVSRQHAMIQNEGSEIRIRDLGSRNGTFVNGEPIIEKCLQVNDLVTLGSQNLRLKEKPRRPDGGEEPVGASGLRGREMFVGSPVELINKIEASTLFGAGDLQAPLQGLKAESVREQYDAMRSLYRISNILASRSDISVKLQAGLEDVVGQVGGECGYILLIDEKSKRLVPLFSCSLVPGQATISKSLAETVVRDRVSVLTDDAMVDSRFSSSESVSSLRIHSALAVPIWTDEDLLGVLYVSHHHKVAWFSRRHLEYASAVGKQMGMAIDASNQMRKNLSLARYLSNARKLLEKKMQDQAGHLQNSLRRQEKTMRQLVDSEGLRTLEFLLSATADRIDKPLAVLKPRLRFIAKYTETLEETCRRYESILTAVKHLLPDYEHKPPSFHESVRKIRETLLVCQSELQELQETGMALTMLCAKARVELERVNVNQQIDAVLTAISPKMEHCEIHVDKELLEPPPELYCDKTGLSQALLAIVINSIESLKRKPPSVEAPKTIRITTKLEHDFLVISISDNGLGIPEQDKAKVFQPFFTTKTDTGGLGMGLPKAQHFALQHGGQIELDSVEGEYVVFRLNLPQDPRARQVDVAQASSSEETEEQ